MHTKQTIDLKELKYISIVMIQCLAPECGCSGMSPMIGDNVYNFNNIK